MPLCLALGVNARGLERSSCCAELCFARWPEHVARLDVERGWHEARLVPLPVEHSRESARVPETSIAICDDEHAKHLALVARRRDLEPAPQRVRSACRYRVRRAVTDAERRHVRPGPALAR